jgi:excisionase family DNA binding protein
MKESDISQTDSDVLFLSVKEAAKLLSISNSQIYKLIYNDGLPAKRIGEGRILISRSELLGWIDRCENV